MEIHYLKRLQQIPKLGEDELEGINLTAIEALETKYNNGNPFPTAFREYLFLAGEYDYLGGHFDAPGYEWMQEKARAELAECGKTIDRPFFVTDQLDGCTQFGFIYLDENEDDPKVYYCYAHPYYWKDIDFITERADGTFTVLIDSCIDLAIRDHKVYFGNEQ